MDPKDDLRILRMVSISDGTAHGIELYDNAIWIIYGAARTVQKHDLQSGRVLETYVFGPDDPDPHGMCIYRGSLYYCDAGIAPGAKPTNSPSAGYVCRVDF